MQKLNNKSSINYQIKSFRWAIAGLSVFFKTEIKARIHILLAIIAIFLSILLKINTTQWLFIILAISLVFISELANTVFEQIANTMPDKFDNKRKTIKDLGAGMVLMACLSSLVIGILVYFPVISHLLK